MIDIERQSFTVSQARRSTLVVAGVLFAIAGWQAYRGHATATAVLVAFAVALVACAAVPAAALWFNKWWMVLAGVLGYINSRILLSILFYLIMTPIGLAVRLAGHDPLTLRQGQEPSFWRRRQHTRQSRNGFERSF